LVCCKAFLGCVSPGCVPSFFPPRGLCFILVLALTALDTAAATQSP
jgi:hypothetical protein